MVSEFASEALRANEEIMSAAVKQDWRAAMTKQAKQGWITRAISNVTSRSRKRSQSNYPDLEEELSEVVPPLPEAKSTALFSQERCSEESGCVELREHSKHLLPEEVVLFEPTDEEMFAEPQEKERKRRHEMVNLAKVPGRVENWVVLVDFENASDVVSLYQLPSMCLTAKALSQTLESVYCCRMVWVKLLNLPTILSRIVQSVIPTEKRKKARYGGIRRDLKGHETYPFRFYPGCRGVVMGAQRLPTCESDRSTTSSNSGSTVDTESEATGTSLHHQTGRKFHEGQLWDTSVTGRWIEEATESSLPPKAAQATHCAFVRRLTRLALAEQRNVKSKPQTKCFAGLALQHS
eukprot:g30501.t1